MTLRHGDPLLAIATIIVIIGQVLMAIAAVALIIAMPVLALFEGAITAELRASFGDPAFLLPTLALLGIMAMALVIAGLVFLFLENLRRIVRTVGGGDPFVPLNARRLTIMAWLMLAVELITIPMAALAMRLANIIDAAEGEGATAAIDFSYDFSGVLLVITLFVLARVFRKGAEMRADLEGTV